MKNTLILAVLSCLFTFQLQAQIIQTTECTDVTISGLDYVVNAVPSGDCAFTDDLTGTPQPFIEESTMTFVFDSPLSSVQFNLTEESDSGPMPVQAFDASDNPVAISLTNVCNSTIVSHGGIPGIDPTTSAQDFSFTVSAASGFKKIHFPVNDGLLNYDIFYATTECPSAMTLLPVELSFFKVENNECQTIVKWQTASEYNTSHFEIEVSNDGKVFHRIEKIQAIGFSLNKKSYQALIKKPTGKKNYFRLKMVDRDDSFSYSKVASIENNCHDYMNGVNIFPNPISANETLKIQFYSNGFSSSFLIKDVFGKTINNLELSKENEGQQYFELEVFDLPAGIYYIMDQTGNVGQFVRL